MDYLPVERTPINLWLAEEGEPTAITVTGHTYWHGISPNRTFAQWFIDVSHEYGHHAFPAFGPFTGNHERYAGGYLSERLNAIWLLEALRSNRAWLPERMTAKAQAELQAYIRQYHLQDVREWCEWLYRQTKAGAMATVNVSEATQIPMSVFLGSAIFIERCFGDSFLKSVLDGCTDQTYDAFIGSFQKHIQRALDEGEVHIDPRITFAVNARTTIAPLGDLIASTHSFTLPSTQLLPMWLPKYTIKCEVSLKLPKGAKVIMHVNGKGVRTNLLPSERQGGCARVIALLDSKIAGWHFIKLQIMGRGEATIERMVLRKVEEVTER
ncbi:MAG TPA: hypothetical protein EYP10_05865 [Armatimonadetes bacterium]|nr:hypothetical protein [Armatimonadota bacterium]